MNQIKKNPQNVRFRHDKLMNHCTAFKPKCSPWDITIHMQIYKSGNLAAPRRGSLRGPVERSWGFRASQKLNQGHRGSGPCLLEDQDMDRKDLTEYDGGGEDPGSFMNSEQNRGQTNTNSWTGGYDKCLRGEVVSNRWQLRKRSQNTEKVPGKVPEVKHETRDLRSTRNFRIRPIVWDIST